MIIRMFCIQLVVALSMSVAQATPVNAQVSEAVTLSKKAVIANKETRGQKNARLEAASYLRYSSFSRIGLIDQLIYEGYTRKEAIYGVDVAKTNWSNQAAKTAASYLRYSSFSRKGLYAQLIYEGFTPHQAAFGVNKAYK